MKENDLQNRAKKIDYILKKTYVDAKCALDFKNPLELLVSTILSAQCTDKRVNLVTPAVFKKYKTAKDYAQANVHEFQTLIRSTGFYQNKTKNILGAMKVIDERHDGKVPQALDELVKLPGIGRKTANVILGNAFGTAGIVVDTHMLRLSHRMGLTKNHDPVKVEFDLMKLIPKREWTMFSHRMIHHGRAICVARKPLCSKCPVEMLCPKIGVKVHA